MIDRLVVIGLGLIGGSLARALKSAGQVKTVVGCNRNIATLELAKQLAVIDEFYVDPALAVQGADMVVLAVPLGTMRSVMEQIKPHLAANAIVTDVGSAKRSILDDAAAVWGGVPSWFVPGHPIAGTENSGVAASFAELFKGRKVIITPHAQTDGQATATVTKMWLHTGAYVSEMSVEHHDEVLAATSHLPHVLAYTLVDALADMEDSREIFAYAAGGFRDFTRIAGSDANMWRDICLANSDALLDVMDRFTADLQKIRQLIVDGQADQLTTIFARAADARRRVNAQLENKHD